MSVQVWTFFFIFLTFVSTLESQYGLGQDQQAIFTLPEAAFPLLQTEWQLPQIGCLLHHLFPWLV